MIANCHLGFVCVDMKESIKFYEKYLGMKTKFSISYAEYVQELEKNGASDPGVEKLKGYAAQGIEWLVYMEWPECPGYFIELFYGEDREQTHKPSLADMGYTHFAVVVDDLKALRERIINAGGEEYLDTGISLGMDNTYQMWMHDPDGNKFEFMQYTDKSFQLVGKTE